MKKYIRIKTFFETILSLNGNEQIHKVAFESNIRDLRSTLEKERDKHEALFGKYQSMLNKVNSIICHD